MYNLHAYSNNNLVHYLPYHQQVEYSGSSIYYYIHPLHPLHQYIWKKKETYTYIQYLAKP